MISPPSLNACHNHNHHQSSTNLSLLSPNKASQIPVSSNPLLNGLEMLSCSLPQSSMSKYATLSSSTPTPISFAMASNPIDVHPYELWSNAAQLPSTGNAPAPLSSSLNSSNGAANINGQETMADLVDGLASLDGYSGISHHLMMPSRSNSSTLKRQKMIYHQKFGEFGVLEGQFTEPSGVAVNGQGDIIVADTNNHRIQIFDSNGSSFSSIRVVRSETSTFSFRTIPLSIR